MRGSITISTPNKTQQAFYLKENNINIESKVQSLLNENCILNQQLEKARFEIENYQQQNEQFQEIKKRVSKLEQLIDTQQTEIEKWKLKYQRAAAGETDIQKMEGQILNVIEENERLNQLIQTMNEQLAEQNNQITSLSNTILQQDIELKKSKKSVEKTNKQAIPWSAFQNDRKGAKQPEIHFIKGKQNDLEQNALSKKNEQNCKQCQQKCNQDVIQLQQQTTQLQNENQQLLVKINELETKLQSQNGEQTVNQGEVQNTLNINSLIIELQEQVQNQQQFVQEEMIKHQQCQQQMEMIKEQLKQFESFFKSLNTQVQNDQIKFNGQLYNQFQTGSENCLRILEQLKNK
ncbi:unnamed protein product (macronuclear) [Paramecium tetraurelia]|uniref:Uncharacterized protein n=1 Tax=Paramecium tetraurelia TaxID=5888 RepID=A0DDC3_PARTE|nr:uncharacterized protein GSPATT00015899001 [Paramecium tetraurelia]CAK81040.1 unnamed protein product [Paramecium tetraurelia]|eukprot:XP_001448437.1 hypothetical protein (macronuclear) [Paramecium tetraurelia strain d4-2]